MLVQLILGSDKTTVSVATGDNEYYPLYMSLGPVWNNVRRAHRNALMLLGFLAIPKSTYFCSVFLTDEANEESTTLADKKYTSDPQFRKFRRQLFHSGLSAILQPLRHAMSHWIVARCPDGHFRRIIFDLGPYIADYMEQVLIANIVQGWCVTYVALISSFHTRTHC